MPPPTAPTGWEWIEATTSPGIENQVNSFVRGFVDSLGNYVYLFHDSNSMRLYYSTDDGDTWSESSTGDTTSTGDLRFSYLFDGENDQIWIAAEAGTDDLVLMLVDWDATNKTFAITDSANIDSGSTGASGAGANLAAFNDYGDAGDRVFIVPGEIDDSNLLNTGIYDHSLTTISGSKPDSWAGTTDHAAEDWGIVVIADHLTNVNDHQQIGNDYANDSAYMFGLEVTTSDLMVWEIHWESGAAEMQNTAAPTILVDVSAEADISAFAGVTGAWYDVTNGRWIVTLIEQGGDTMIVAYNDNTDPTAGTWTHSVWMDNKADTNIFLDDIGVDCSPIYDPVNQKVVWLNCGYDTNNADQDWYLWEYDIAGDSWTETAIGFSDSAFYSISNSTKVGGMTMKRGDGSDTITLGFFGLHQDSSNTYWPFWYHYADVVGSSAGGPGWGFIPIGI